MDRRSFLVGSGAVLTTAFVAKAKWYIRNKNAVVPLDVTSVNTSKLYFVNQGSEYELRLGTPDFGFEELTYREVLNRYRSVYLPKDEKISLSEFRQVYDDWGIKPKQLDQIADLYDYIDEWGRSDAPKAKAFRYLECLNLFNDEDREGLRVGDLTFVDGPCPGNDYLGVTSFDPITASLLQARLLELGEDVCVEIVD